ncbi:MAG: hypothetical protein HY788_21880 [Deltaproteobacteria bacterium]|nr:hypothetical protein [Deltaproteobacteria bacterium]
MQALPLIGSLRCQESRHVRKWFSSELFPIFYQLSPKAHNYFVSGTTAVFVFYRAAIIQAFPSCLALNRTSILDRGACVLVISIVKIEPNPSVFGSMEAPVDILFSADLVTKQ